MFTLFSSSVHSLFQASLLKAPLWMCHLPLPQLAALPPPSVSSLSLVSFWTRGRGHGNASMDLGKGSGLGQKKRHRFLSACLSHPQQMQQVLKILKMQPGLWSRTGLWCGACATKCGSKESLGIESTGEGWWENFQWVWGRSWRQEDVGLTRRNAAAITTPSTWSCWNQLGVGKIGLCWELNQHFQPVWGWEQPFSPWVNRRLAQGAVPSSSGSPQPARSVWL